MGEIIKTIIKYAEYCRKSSEAEDKQALSIPSQKEENTKVVKNEGLHMYKTYEEARSAKIPNNRPEFEKMLDDIRTGRAQGILTWNVNRISRNATDTGKIIQLMDDGLLFEVKTPTQIFKNTPNDKFLLNLFCSQAKLENDNKGVDVKRGLGRKANDGWLPGVAPLGYLNDPSPGKGFKIVKKDPERFDLLRMAWDLLLKGIRVKEILRILNEDYGFRTRQFKKQGGKPISPSMLYKIFSDPFYYGYFEYPKGDGDWHKGKHEHMVEEEEFKKAQCILHKNMKTAPKTKVFAYTGLMRCGQCGASITAEEKYSYQKNGNVHHYIYYRCTKKKTANCTERYVEVKELERQIQEILSEVEIDEDFKNIVKPTKAGVILISPYLSTRQMDDLLTDFIRGKNPDDFLGKATKI